MRIFYLSYISKTGEFNAAYRHTFEICNEMAKNGADIYLFSPLSVRSDYISHEVTCITVPTLPKGLALLKILSFYFSLIPIALYYCLLLKPHTIYSRASAFDFITMLPLKTVYKFKYVAEINGIRSIETKNNTLNKHILKLFEKISFRLCDRVICVTGELKKWIIKIGSQDPVNVAVISNGVNINKFFPIEAYDAKNRLRLDTNKRYLIFSASMKAWHGTKYLMDALKLLHRKGYGDVQCIVLGTGPDLNLMQKYAYEQELEGHVIWAGKVRFEDVPSYLNASEICLAPFIGKRNSITGLSPLKVYEYMACGKPFITNKVGASFDRFVENSNCGLTVDSDDPELMAEKIAYLLTNEKIARRMGMNGRLLAETEFSWDILGSKIINFLKPQAQ